MNRLARPLAWPPLAAPDVLASADHAQALRDGWPQLRAKHIESFHALRPDVIRGPARLYRVVSARNRALGACWFSEEVHQRIQRAPDPCQAWRRHLAVWPHWNAEGHYVVAELAAGDALKVWRGPAASQTLPHADAPLDGGWEQIVIGAAEPARLQLSGPYPTGWARAAQPSTGSAAWRSSQAAVALTSSRPALAFAASR